MLKYVRGVVGLRIFRVNPGPNMAHLHCCSIVISSELFIYSVSWLIIKYEAKMIPEPV